MRRTIEEIRHTRFMRQFDRNLNRMRRALRLIQEMDSADRSYLLSRLKAKECAVQHQEQSRA